MAISGKLLADFSDFETACKNAETKLVSFETGANKVQASLQRMETSLSGRKLIQDATLAVQAVENIGGVSKLTEKQIQQLAAQATEAVAKMKAMGIDVPPGMQKIADAAKAADTAHQGLGSTVKDLIVSYVALSTVRAIYDYAKQIVNEASAMKDLSQQTHINVEELQLLAGGMSEFGVDADTLGKGLFKLSRGIAGGDESVATGLHLMGLSLKDVEGLNGKELFLKIEGGLATLQGGLRDTAAAELFGGKLGAAMAGASEGIESTLEKWQRLNTVASTESVDALDAYGESIERASKSLNAMATNVMGKSADMFNVVTDAVDKGGGKWATFWALTKDVTAQLTMTGSGTENMTRLLDDLNQKTDASAAATKNAADAHRDVAGAIDTRTAAEKFMAALETDAAKALTASQLTNLAHLKEIGALTAANAAGIGVNAAQFDHYKASIEAAKQAEQELKKTSDEARKLEAAGLLQTTKLWDEYYALRTSHGGTANEIEMANIKRLERDTIAAAIKAGTATTEFYTGLAALSKEKMAGVGVDWDLWKTKSIGALNETAENARRTLNEMIASGKFLREDIDQQREKWEEARDAARGYGKDSVAAHQAAEAAAKKNTAALEAVKKAEDDAAAAAKNRAMGNSTEVDVSTQAGRDAVDPKIATWLHDGYSLAQASAIAYMLMAGVPVNGNDPLFKTKGPRVPGFAGGVENFGGGLAMVGERGPELVTLPGGSSVTPNSGVSSSLAEWDRLNEKQAAMWIAAGRVVTAEQQKIIDQMRPLTPVGFGDREQPPVTQVFNLYGTTDELLQKLKTHLMREAFTRRQFGAA